MIPTRARAGEINSRSRREGRYEQQVVAFAVALLVDVVVVVGAAKRQQWANRLRRMKGALNWIKRRAFGPCLLLLLPLVTQSAATSGGSLQTGGPGARVLPPGRLPVNLTGRKERPPTVRLQLELGRRALRLMPFGRLAFPIGGLGPAGARRRGRSATGGRQQVALGADIDRITFRSLWLINFWPPKSSSVSPPAPAPTSSRPLARIWRPSATSGRPSAARPGVESQEQCNKLLLLPLAKSSGPDGLLCLCQISHIIGRPRLLELDTTGRCRHLLHKPGGRPALAKPLADGKRLSH